MQASEAVPALDPERVYVVTPFLVTHTLWVPDTAKEAAHYEVHGVSPLQPKKMPPANGKGSCLSGMCACAIFVTRDETVNAAAIEAEGTGRAVGLKWKGRRRESGGVCSVLYGVVPLDARGVPITTGVR
jgi:hypothetical protein